MEKKEITKETIKELENLPKDNRSFIIGYMQGVTDIRDKRGEEDERRRDLQEAN